MLKAYINSEAYELANDYTLTEKIGSGVSSSIAVYLKEGQKPPRSGEIIEIKDNDTCYFLGVCGIPKSPKFKSLKDPKKYALTCGSANAILERRVVNVAYKGYTISEIVKALFDNYIAAEGFTLGSISEMPYVVNIYTAGDYSLKFCLDELAEYVSGAWHCSVDRKFFFVSKLDLAPVGFIVDKNFLPFSDLEIRTKDTDLRTQQTVTGGTSATSEQTEVFIYNEEIKDYIISFSLLQAPEILINDVGLNSNLIGIKGINDDDNRYMFRFAFNSPIVSYNPFFEGEKLKTNDKITIKYVGSFPIRVTIQNSEIISELAKRSGTSGIIDNVKVDKSLKDINDALNIGTALLENYGYVRTEIKCSILSNYFKEEGLDLSDIELLRKWTFNLPELGVEGDFVLIEKSSSPVIYDEETTVLKINLTFCDRAYLEGYGRLFDDMKKTLAQLSIRQEDIILDLHSYIEALPASESLDITEEESDGAPLEPLSNYEYLNIEEKTDFLIAYCTNQADQLASPNGLYLYAYGGL